MRFNPTPFVRREAVARFQCDIPVVPIAKECEESLSDHIVENTTWRQLDECTDLCPKKLTCLRKAIKSSARISAGLHE